MSTTVGRVDWIAGIDGTLLPSEAKRLGDRIGQALGQAAARRASRSFAQGLGSDSQINDLGELLGRRLADRMGAAFRGRFQAALGDAGASIRRALDAGPARQFAEAAERGVFVMHETREAADRATDSTGRLRAAADRLGDSFRGVQGRVRSFFADASDGGRGLGSVISGLNDRWRGMTHGLRQGIFYVGLFINLIPSLAVLSSAAGSGLLVLGGAVASLGIGLIGTISALTVLMGDIDGLPAELRPARAGLDDLKDSFRELGRAMSIAAFARSEGAWRSLGSTVRALTPDFEEVGRVVGRLLEDLATELKPGTKAFKDLSGFVRSSASVFDRVVRSVGQLGRALLSAFNNPTFQRALDGLLGYLDTLIDRFETFVNGPGFDEWIGNGIRIFGALAPLLDTTARMLNDLVTPESVDRLVDFFGNIERFIATGGAGILEFASELDIFGVIADALGTFGEALEPLRQPMIDLAAGVRDILSSGIETLGPVVKAVADALAPLVQGLADFMRQNPDAIAAGLVAIAAGFLAVKGVNGIAGLSGVLTDVIGKFDDITKKAPTWKGAVAGLAAGVLASLPGVTDGEVAGQDVVTGLVGGLTAGFVFGGPVGAAIGAIGALLTTMISDMISSQEGVWNQGWDQIFAPGDYTGAGIGQFKQWLDEQFGPWLTELVNGWGSILTTFRDATLPAWTAGFIAGWNGFLAQITGDTGGWLDQIVTRWGENLATIKSNVEGWWGGVVAGWNNFWTMVGITVAVGWNRIVSTITQGLGGLAGAWNGFWSGLGGIVSSVWSGIVSTVAGAVNSVISLVNSLISKINAGLRAIRDLTGGLVDLKIPSIPGLPRAAAGMITRGPTLAGEDGPELIVPLRRPLSRINPEVREIAREIRTGGDNVTTIAPGAIVVEDRSGDPRRTANEVLTRLAERAAG
jgi:phage-related protein